MSKNTTKRKGMESSPAKLLSQKKKESKTPNTAEEKNEVKYNPMDHINSKVRSESKPKTKTIEKPNDNVNLIEDDVIDELVNHEGKKDPLRLALQVIRVFNFATLVEPGTRNFKNDLPG